MKLLDSSSLLVEPVQSRKFARFSLQYTEIEEKIIENEKWESRFAGHQTLIEREESFIAHDQRINCGFVKGPKGSPSTGFDVAEDDAKYISSCHIAVISCVFGNSDRLRSPMGRTVSRASRKNVCFVMFMDELTLQALSSEGQTTDMMGFIGLWRIVVVKNLPYTDMRRVGKIPKFLPHRLFPSARYSIWLDSKLRLQLDPLVILEYFLWRKDYEYAISNHYDRHCLWEEVAQNKKLNKYNHTVIDEQFAFYQADRMKRFNASDPDKLLPSNVPEGSFIVRAHTPMSNLFSCLWFNEVDRFTPRDQLSFAYTYHKLRRKNPDKPFYLNMFKDCERRKIAKLYHHRLEEKRNIPQIEMG
ncbi:putative hexosyltransferase MUCI70 [Primulina tabacum]|uniref:putative hexosyltransferase MUCI70 n=1 Tax=Primulina tabacum TaxID=48773 RepID=UPI003F5A45EC